MPAVDHYHHLFDMCHEERVQQTQARSVLDALGDILAFSWMTCSSALVNAVVAVSTFLPPLEDFAQKLRLSYDIKLVLVTSIGDQTCN